MKLLLLLAHLSICFAKDFLYKDKIANAKYGGFGATLATSGNKLIVGTVTMSAAPIFINTEGKTETLPPPPGAFLFGLNVAANEHFILTNCATGNKPPLSWSINVYDAKHPHELVVRIPVERRGFVGAGIGEDSTIFIVTEASTVIAYSYNGQRAWSKEKEWTLRGKHPLYPSRTVTVSGNHAAVGMATFNGEGVGRVEVFERLRSAYWHHTQTINSTVHFTDYQYFGASVAMHKDHMVISAMKDNKEQHAFVYFYHEYTALPYRWLPTAHLTIPIPSPEGGYSPTFGVDCLIGDRKLVAVSTKIKGTIATKIFREGGRTWVEHANLKAEPMNPLRQSNAAVRFGANNIVYTGRIDPFVGSKGGAVYVHDLSKHNNE